MQSYTQSSDTSACSLRYYFRCVDCLSVVATETKIQPVQLPPNYNPSYGECGACSGRIEYLGRVQGGRLQKIELAVPCDARCTGALGPHCDCQCGGKNHGSNRVVEVVIDGGPVPRLMVPDGAKAKAEQYRALLSDIKAAHAVRFGSVFELKRNGVYLERAEFREYCAGQWFNRRVLEARQLRTHASRNRKLNAILSEVRGTSGGRGGVRMTSNNTQRTPAAWAELLRDAVTVPGTISQAFSRFHNYSVGNQLLAHFQCKSRGITPGPIGTFMHWKDVGRHVKKGEKALTLCMPITCKGKRTADGQAEGGTNADSTSDDFTFTRFVYRNNWFVLSQTDGADYKPEPLPGWDADRALAALKIERAPFTMLDGNVQGYAQGRKVAINPVAEQPESTLFHEIGHIVLGHTTEGAVNSDSKDRTPRDIRELEAECVALICTESLGLPGAELSRGYIQHWFRGREVPERSAQRIFHAADSILRAGRTDYSHSDQPACGPNQAAVAGVQP